ncbi:MAG TPA: hypothetical protein VGX25_03465 [Actinophytocola sp.]|uniref:hypothetical protein n=1 Tax=Actinophytocola sp. TaxID=1872138 RepID=UPI002DDCD470|nr:hypothetical protein [Actinophytocola sp.]HEV2778438.1 hypothetical protein [Actinophytocola sp.]
MHNEIKVGGNVGGNVVAGQHNVVGQPSAPPPEHAPVPEGFTPRIGFVVDMVGFGRRGAHDRDDLQHRLDHLVGLVVADLGFRQRDMESAVAGDSKVVFLPVGADSSRIVPVLVSALSERLARDNTRYRDRMRLRMAIGTGLLGNGPLGFTGDLIVDLHRLVDSDVLRAAIAEDEAVDLAILLTHTLHDEVLRPGFLDKTDFTRVEITMKEYTGTAWLGRYPLSA